MASSILTQRPTKLSSAAKSDDRKCYGGAAMTGRRACSESATGSGRKDNIQALPVHAAACSNSLR